MPRKSGLTVRQVYPVNEPQASIGAGNPDRMAQVRRFMKGGNDEPDEAPKVDQPEGLAFLQRVSQAAGDISDLLESGIVSDIGLRAIREWEIDHASRSGWLETAERALALCAQETDGNDEFQREGPFEGSADIHYPILTTATTQFNARATPELIKGDKVVGVKTFNPPARQPSPPDMAQAAQSASPPPQPGSPPSPQQQAEAQGLQQANQAEIAADLQAKAKMARGQRVAHYMNWVIFYEMDNWEDETDLLLMEMPPTGVGFRKVYMGPHSLCSDYVSAICLTVHNTTKNLQRCPRITQEFEIYPYEIEQGKASGQYRNVSLTGPGEDPEAPRKWIEQHRLEDLDHDGIAEPYIVTVDVDTRQTMRIEAAFIPSDVMLTEDGQGVKRIERWVPFATYKFLPDPRGRFYALGLGKLLDAITDSVDTGLNQLIDAGNAQIAGGGFIGANVRLQGSGQGGAVYKQPGEWQTVSTPGPDLKQSLYEFTVPQPSAVTMQMLEVLLAAAKDISSVKDVISGDAPNTAPVGTTLALQNQALQVFSAIYKRIYRGFREEFRLMYECLRRWPNEEIRRKYAELTGGNFDDDFSGDGTDIQPVADPSVVTKMQKISRMQTVLALAESPVGMAAGMQQAGPAQALITEALDVLEIERPERFLAAVPPNPELLAKVQEMAAGAALKQAQAQHAGAKIVTDNAAANLDMAKTVKEMGEVGEQAHRLHQEAHRVATQGLAPPPEGQDANSPAPAAAP